MTSFILTIGNKNYSSWSMRPWLALTAAGIPFEERLIPFDDAAGNPAIKAVSPNGKVPFLVDGELAIGESLAIIEYAAECFPDRPVWPKDRTDRARARSLAMRMATGFQALRNACPMNLRRPKSAIAVSDAVRADVRTIEGLWREAIDRSGGPFLFGAFSAADAMFAPVVNRLETYDLTTDPGTLAYMAAVKAHPAFKAWETAALQETWIVPEDEV